MSGRTNSSITPASNSSLDLTVGLSGLHPAVLNSTNQCSMVLMGIERSKVTELALAAMGELKKIIQAEEPLWVRNLEGGMETEEYSREFARLIGPKPIGRGTEATRHTDIVVMKSSTIVDTLINVVCK